MKLKVIFSPTTNSIALSIAIALTLLALIAVAFSIIRQSSLERSKMSLERTNIRFRAALENMTHGLCMFDADKRLVIFNHRYAELYDLPPTLLKVGTPYEKLISRGVESDILAQNKDTNDKVGALAQLLNAGAGINHRYDPTRYHWPPRCHDDR